MKTVKVVSLFILIFTQWAFGATQKSSMKTENVQIDDKFAHFVMKGFSVSLEHSRLGGSGKIKASNGYRTVTSTMETNAPAPTLGVAVNYSHLPRNNSGWAVGATLVNKTENDSKDSNSLKATKSFTQFRPEGNLAYALSNGLWGMIGGHLSYLTTDDIEIVNSLGIGAQASIGYTPVKNFSIDLGYYLSHHRLSDKMVNFYEDNGFTVKKNESYVIFNQLRARVSYYF